MTAYQRRPCDECPWRLDAVPGRFPPERYAALENTHGARGREAPLGAPLFACHKTMEGRDAACAGFLAVEGYNHLGVRLVVLLGNIPIEALTPGADWPPLHATYASMAGVNQ